MTERSEIDDAWGELLDDEPPPAPASVASASVVEAAGADAVPPPPTFAPHLEVRKRGDSVVESMHDLMDAESGPAPAATPSDVPDERASEDSGATASVDPSSASGSMPKLWEALWADTDKGEAREEREEDSVAALLPTPPVLQPPAAAVEPEDSGVGLRLAPPVEPEPPARLGPDERRGPEAAIEQSVELKRPPRVAEEVDVAPGRSREDEIDDVPAVAAHVAEEAPVRPRARASVLASNSHEVVDAANTRPRTVWIGGAALLATAAIVGVVMRGGAETASTADTEAKTSAPPAAAQAEPRPSTAKPGPELASPAAAARDAKADDDLDPDAPEAAPEDAPEAAPEPPTAAAHDPAPAKASPPPTSGAPDYETAKAEYEATGSQDALATMVEAACAMDDGPSARSAFRKLKPTDLRKAALKACNAFDVDPTLSIEGPTADELVRKARRELSAGDPAAAMATARESNRMKRSSDAVVVMMLAACAQSDAEEARRLRKHVARGDRAEVDAACAAKGIDLAAPSD